jgi:hypothetical protein
LPDEKRIKLFLTPASSGTVSRLHDGSLSAELSQPAAHRYAFDPSTSRNPVDVSVPNIVLVHWQGPGLNAEPFSFTIHTGRDRASFMEIPVIGDGWHPVT